MKRVVATALVGWAGIVALTWWLADRRIEVCRYSDGYTCALRATTARDAALTHGLTVAVVIVVAAFLWAGLRTARSPSPRRFRIALPEANIGPRFWLWWGAAASLVPIVALAWILVTRTDDPPWPGERVSQEVNASAAATDAALAASQAAYEAAADASVAATEAAGAASAEAFEAAPLATQEGDDPADEDSPDEAAAEASAVAISPTVGTFMWGP